MRAAPVRIGPRVSRASAAQSNRTLLATGGGDRASHPRANRLLPKSAFSTRLSKLPERQLHSRHRTAGPRSRIRTWTTSAGFTTSPSSVRTPLGLRYSSIARVRRHDRPRSRPHGAFRQTARGARKPAGLCVLSVGLCRAHTHSLLLSLRRTAHRAFRSTRSRRCSTASMPRRRSIATERRAVVVEGYTDVMAAHLAGVEGAVATCGTAFGVEHIKILRRIMRDEADVAPARVVFTFDGDAAGQKAAMKAFGEDQRWAAQSFVAVAPDETAPARPAPGQGRRRRARPRRRGRADVRVRRAHDDPALRPRDRRGTRGRP